MTARSSGERGEFTLFAKKTRNTNKDKDKFYYVK